MPDTTTPRLGLTKMEFGQSENTWGGKTNDNMDKIDAGVASAMFGGPILSTTSSGNTITITDPRFASRNGQSVRFSSPIQNTAGVTIRVNGTDYQAMTETDVALPAGYLKLGNFYEAIQFLDRMIIRRPLERGSNANGEWVRYGDGTQICTADGGPQDVGTASGVGFSGTTIGSWTFPMAFAAFPVVSGSVQGSTTRWLIAYANSSGAASYRQASFAANGSALASKLMAVGRWY